jgi:hypothetical protein
MNLHGAKNVGGRGVVEFGNGQRRGDERPNKASARAGGSWRMQPIIGLGGVLRVITLRAFHQ